MYVLRKVGETSGMVFIQCDIKSILVYLEDATVWEEPLGVCSTEGFPEGEYERVDYTKAYLVDKGWITN